MHPKARSNQKLRPLMIAAACLLATSCDALNTRRVGPGDAYWIERALDHHIGPKLEDRRFVLSYSEPIVVYLPDMVCVAFKLRKSAIGGESTICFDRNDETLKINYTDGM